MNEGFNDPMLALYTETPYQKRCDSIVTIEQTVPASGCPGWVTICPRTAKPEVQLLRLVGVPSGCTFRPSYVFAANERKRSKSGSANTSKIFCLCFGENRAPSAVCSCKTCLIATVVSFVFLHVCCLVEFAVGLFYVVVPCDFCCSW